MNFFSLWCGDDGEPLQAFGVGDLRYDEEPGHDEEAATLNAGFERALAVNADNLDAAAAPEHIGYLIGRVARESRGAHRVAVDPHKIGAQTDLADEGEVLGVEDDDTTAALDIHIKRRFEAVENHPLAIGLGGLRHRLVVGDFDDEGALLASDELLGIISGEVPRTADELGGEAGEDALGTGDLEVREFAGEVALRGVAEEEDNEMGGGGVEPPRHDAEGKSNGVAPFDGKHLLFRRFGKSNSTSAAPFLCEQNQYWL